MKSKDKRIPGLILVCLFLTLSMSTGWSALAKGVYAYVDVRGAKDSTAIVREYVSLSRRSGGYYIRLTSGSQIKLSSNNYRGAVSYPSVRSSHLPTLKSKRAVLRDFMSKFPASQRYLRSRSTQLSRRILEVESQRPVKQEVAMSLLVLKNGKKYRSVVVRGRVEEGLKILHQSGVATIPFDLLPDDVAKQYPKLETKKSPEEAELAGLKKKAEQGVLEAQLKLAHDYHSGLTIPRDLGEAFKYYKMAGSQENPEAQLLVGMCYYKGEGVDKNLNKCVFWMEKSAKLGYALAETSLGALYLRGEGVRKDASVACEWFEKAAASDHADAQYLLAVCYFLGEGVDKDEVKAKKWLKKAIRSAGTGSEKFYRLPQL